MTDRETFLNRIRERRQHPYHYPLNDPGPDVPKSVLDEDLPAPDLIEHFTRMLEDVGGQVVRISNPEAAREWLVGFVVERGLERAVITRDVPVEGLATALTDAGLAVTMPPAGESVGHAAGQAFRHACVDADLGVTSADFAVADTGTLVLLARSGAPRMASLLPPIHVALVGSDQLIPNLSVLIDRLRSDAWRDGLPSAMTLITGPSRTGDIEQTLSVGVHGPAEVCVVVIG
ncbi:MAG: lactate utilization protein C [Anaerolineae bacterium]